MLPEQNMAPKINTNIRTCRTGGGENPQFLISTDFIAIHKKITPPPTLLSK